tara:strand:+ start:3726 stop:3917 length:192 start_codon:yes stop_codon:yes gene_type:complete
MDWKRVPKIDKELVQYLKEKFSTPKYDPEATNDELVRLLAVQYGRDEAIAAIESLITLQQKRR